MRKIWKKLREVNTNCSGSGSDHGLQASGVVDEQVRGSYFAQTFSLWSSFHASAVNVCHLCVRLQWWTTAKPTLSSNRSFTVHPVHTCKMPMTWLLSLLSLAISLFDLSKSCIFLGEKSHKIKYLFFSSSYFNSSNTNSKTLGIKGVGYDEF